MEEYVKELEKKIKDKNLYTFWVFCDRVDFKPIKDTTKSEIKKYVKKKVQYYANKKIAWISLYTNLDAFENENELVFSIKIFIYEINEDGLIEQERGDNWGLMINYYIKDLEEKKFKLKDVEKLMRWGAEKIIRTDTLNGIKYTNLLKRLKEKGLDKEWND